MQAKDIQIGGSYAVKISGRLSELKVSKVVTSRSNGGTHSTVIGVIMSGEPDAENAAKNVGPFEVAQILGPIEEHRKLVEERQAREKAHKEQMERLENNRIEAVKLLGPLIAPEFDKDDLKYKIEASYKGIIIHDDFLPRLVELLKLVKEAVKI